MKIAVFSKSLNQIYQQVYEEFFACCEKLDIDYIVNQDFNFNLFSKKYVKEDLNVFDSKKELESFAPDYFFSIGGDGTFLEAMLLVRETNIPMLGINTGRLGFLANNPNHNFEPLFHELAQNNYSLEKRTLLKLNSNKDIFGKHSYALNDFTIHKRDNSSLTEITTYVNGKYFNTYWGDGLIVSTPTGSTAYSMSCGGPIVFPESNVFLITPVASHNLGIRPVIIPDHLELSFAVKAREKNFLVALDSRYQVIDRSYRINITKARFFVYTIRFNNQSFSEVIREKLSWGKDNRNN